MVGTNLFFHRGPVSDPAYFFGRKQELAQLFDLLKRSQSVSISGQRRLGKTSLLYHAMTPEVAIAHGIDPAQARWVYVDGGMLDGLEEESVYGAIDRGMQEGESERVPYEQLLDHVRALAGHDLRLMVILDEFEIFAGNVRLQPRLLTGCAVWLLNFRSSL